MKVSDQAKLWCLILIIETTVADLSEAKRLKAKVLILGGGAAGMAAMKELSDKGIHDFILIEGEERLGGRVKDTQFGGKTIELGANWVQGLEGNPFWDMAKKYKLEGLRSDFDSYIIRDENGTDVTSQADEQFELIVKAHKTVEKIVERRRNENLEDIPMRAALSVGGWPRVRTAIQDVVEGFTIDFQTAAFSEETSLLHYGPVGQKKFEYGDYFVTDQRGFRSLLLDELVKPISKKVKGRLFFNEVVTKVEYGNNEVKVTTNSGNIFAGEIAIVTFSIGVMQSNQVTFIPSMPDSKREAYASFSMKTYTKIFMKFADTVEPFWDPQQYIFYASDTRGYYPWWQNLEAEGLHEKNTNLLLVTVTGYESERIARLSKDEIKKELTQVLRDMYGKDVPEPEDILVPDWYTNPLYLGSYSQWPPWVDDKMHTLMGSRLGRLFFAGEGYSKDHYGYLHGAMFSGQQIADHVSRCFLEKERGWRRWGNKQRIERDCPPDENADENANKNEI